MRRGVRSWEEYLPPLSPATARELLESARERDARRVMNVSRKYSGATCSSAASAPVLRGGARRGTYAGDRRRVAGAWSQRRGHFLAARGLKQGRSLRAARAEQHRLGGAGSGGDGRGHHRGAALRAAGAGRTGRDDARREPALICCGDAALARCIKRLWPERAAQYRCCESVFLRATHGSGAAAAARSDADVR